MDPASQTPYGLIDDGALVVGADAKIAWIGPVEELPPELLASADTVEGVAGAVITPGLVDAHTHLVYAGNRARDFEQRLAGVHYAEIAHAGGGILSTVRATRDAGFAALESASERRLRALASSGVTTVEIKSGYGLDRETELTMLRVARALGERCDVEVCATYLGLHAVPPDCTNADDYVAFVIEEMLPAVAAEHLASAVDAFCETIAFSSEQIARYFEAARALGFDVKLHADQLSDGGGAALAARFGALSADHLEHASTEAIAALAASGTVAVLLPGATYFLREHERPPVRELRRRGVPIAISTDCNPGTSPLVSMPLAMNLACTLFDLTPEEALLGATRNAARALGLGERVGTLRPGLAADFVVWDVEHPREIAYGIGVNPVRKVVRGGRSR